MTARRFADDAEDLVRRRARADVTRLLADAGGLRRVVELAERVARVEGSRPARRLAAPG